jgi:hypothetical protein
MGVKSNIDSFLDETRLYKLFQGILNITLTSYFGVKMQMSLALSLPHDNHFTRNDTTI